MKLLIACTITMLSTSAFAMSDQDICISYGQALASNSQEAQLEFFSEQNTRVKSGSWTLNPEQCQQYIQQGKHDYELDLALELWPD